MEITRIEKVNFVSEVYRQLRQMIVSGTWEEGNKIASENELAKTFHVSRVVIREALQMLRTEKLIVTRQGLGSFVANPNNFIHPDKSLQLSVESYQHFIEFRNAVEISAIKLSVNTATEEDFAQVQACIDQMDSSKEDVVSYSEADYNYHLAVIRCAHNEFLERAMQANQNAVTSVLQEMNSLPKSQRYGVTTHIEIFEDMKNKRVKKIISDYDRMAKYNLARLSEFFADSQKNH